MHYPKRMLESSMGCTGINIICPCQLFYSPESLKSWVVDNLAFKLRHANEAVHWASDLTHELIVIH